MNVILREVFQTSADGERFWKMKECYVRGNTVSPQEALRERASSTEGGEGGEGWAASGEAWGM